MLSVGREPVHPARGIVDAARIHQRSKRTVGRFVSEVQLRRELHDGAVQETGHKTGKNPLLRYPDPDDFQTLAQFLYLPRRPSSVGAREIRISERRHDSGLIDPYEVSAVDDHGVTMVSI